MFQTEKKISRLVLKENDILVLKIPIDYFNHRNALSSIYRQIREKLLDSGKKNKILMIPDNVKMCVIGEEEVTEHVSNFDLWYLWSEDEETDD